MIEPEGFRRTRTTNTFDISDQARLGSNANTANERIVVGSATIEKQTPKLSPSTLENETSRCIVGRPWAFLGSLTERAKTFAVMFSAENIKYRPQPEREQHIAR